MIKKLCRLCLAKTRTLIKVSEVPAVSGGKLNLEDLIHRYLPIDRSYRGVTIMLCTKCAKVLKDWHTFYQSCLENDTKYIKTLETKLEKKKRIGSRKSRNSSRSALKSYGFEKVLIESEFVPKHRNEPSANSSIGSSCGRLPAEDMLEETASIDVAENQRPEETNGDEMLMETKLVQRCQSSNTSKKYSSSSYLSGNVDFQLVVVKPESTIYEDSVTEQTASDNEINSIYDDMDDGRDDCNTGPIKKKPNYTDGQQLCDTKQFDFESMGHEPEFVCLTDNISDDNVQNDEPIFGLTKSPTMCSDSKSVTAEPSSALSSVTTVKRVRMWHEPEFVCLTDNISDDNVQNDEPIFGLTKSPTMRSDSKSVSPEPPKPPEPESGTVKRVRKARDENSGVCHICGLFRKHLPLHMKIHSGERNHKCPYCPAAFVDSSSCKQHINAHTREKMYKCNLCDKEYSSLNVLRNHKDSHSEKKKHVCKICNNAYRYRAALRRHIKTHTDEPKIKCTECEMRFYYKGRMLSHLRSHFDPEFSCAICDKRYTKKSSLDTHIKTKHKDQNACPQGLPTDASS